MASPDTPASRDDTPPAASAPGGARGVRAAVIGGAVMVLAPLFGFLGGSMSGSSAVREGPDPLVMWLFGGLVVGGLAGIVAILGLLRWTRDRTDRP